MKMILPMSSGFVEFASDLSESMVVNPKRFFFGRLRFDFALSDDSHSLELSSNLFHEWCRQAFYVRKWWENSKYLVGSFGTTLILLHDRKIVLMPVTLFKLDFIVKIYLHRNSCAIRYEAKQTFNTKTMQAATHTLLDTTID